MSGTEVPFFSALDVPRLPEGEIIPALREARSEAVEAMLAAEEADKIARQARRRARQKLKLYDRLLQEHSGQLSLPVDT